VSDRWRFECKYECNCECPPTLETGCAPCGSQTTSIGLSSPMQVTLSLVRLIEALVSQPTQVLDSVEERSPGGGDLALPGDCSVTDHIPIPTVSWLGLAWGWESANPNLNPNLTLPLTTRRNGIVGFLSS
jgi:hypothetical protein